MTAPEEHRVSRLAALVGQRRYAEAEPLLVAGYQGLTETEPAGPRGHHSAAAAGPVTNTLDWLVRLYDGWGQPARGAKWRAELEARRPAPAGARK